MSQCTPSTTIIYNKNKKYEIYCKEVAEVMVGAGYGGLKFISHPSEE
jgi:hypothetical protein